MLDMFDKIEALAMLYPFLNGDFKFSAFCVVDVLLTIEFLLEN